MNYRQLIKPNIAINENAGWCLSYARRVFGRPVVEATAWAGWQNTKFKHKNRNFPKGVSFPVWFDWWGDVGNGRHRYGHVAVVHTDGRVWSSPLSGHGRAWFASVDDLVRAFGGGMKYVGWSEDISGARIIEPTKGGGMLTRNLANIIVRFYRGREANATEVRNYVGKVSAQEFADRISQHNDSKKRVDAARQGRLAAVNHLPQAVRNVYVDPNAEALKQANAALDAACKEAGMTAELRRQVDAAQQEAENAIRRVTELEVEREQRDEAVNSIWQTIGDLINKLLRR